MNGEKTKRIVYKVHAAVGTVGLNTPQYIHDRLPTIGHPMGDRMRPELRAESKEHNPMLLQ